LALNAFTIFLKAFTRGILLLRRALLAAHWGNGFRVFFLLLKAFTELA
jgi:hypothetical protein